jgi:Ca2+-binding RTX toxin-like protein
LGQETVFRGRGVQRDVPRGTLPTTQWSLADGTLTITETYLPNSHTGPSNVGVQIVGSKTDGIAVFQTDMTGKFEFGVRAFTPGEYWPVNNIVFNAGPAGGVRFENCSDIADWVYGSSGTDVLIGGSGDNHLFSGGGSSTLIGGAGNNYLQGNSDGVPCHLVGGSGHNTFILQTWLDTTTIYRKVDVNPDVITNQHSGDTIEFLGPQPLLAAI